jgi:glycosyltransferase involved in cell wall biosynthesis
MRRALLAFEPPDGGVPENVAQIALGLTAHGWHAEVAGPPDASIYDELEAAGVRVHRLPLQRTYGRTGADLHALMKLSALLRNGSFDLVHSHAAKAGVLARVAAFAARTPSLYSPHCFAFAGRLGWPLRSVAANVERLLGRLGGDILCVCESERELALRARVASPGRLHVVYNGAQDCASEREPEATMASMRARGPLAGAVAALRPQKSLQTLIDATPLVLARVPDAGVAIVGNGPLREQLQTRATRLGLDRDERFALLEFTAPASRQTQALDVYVLPSAWEALPIGVLEALACGVPQVVSDVGGNREAVTPATGTLVPPGDPQALADAIVALLSDPARRSTASEASRRRHAERFTVARMVAETAVLYDSVLARASTGD